MTSSDDNPQLQPITSLQTHWLAVLASVPKRGNVIASPSSLTTCHLTFEQRTRTASIVREHVRSGNRHDIARDLSGMLARAGVNKEQTQEIFYELFDDDPEIDDRLRCVDDSYYRLREGLPVSGFPSLETYLPRYAVLELKDVLPRHTGLRTRRIEPDRESDLS